MKFAYLIHYMKKNFDEITENLDTLLDAGDDCYIIVNENDLRDDLLLSYADEPRMHLVHKQEAALPGDLSLARGTLLSIIDAIEFEKENDFTYDYFINLTDGMIPLKSKKEIEDYLSAHKNKDIYYVENTSDKDSEIKKRFEEYAFFTNSMDFERSKIIKGMNKLTANLVGTFKHKNFDDTLVLTYPWFILTHESAKAISENLAYCSENFKMCLYPEELAFGTMLKKFSNVEHHNENVWSANPDGKYQFCQAIKNVSRQALNKDALFGAKIHSDDNFEIYQDYFDVYLNK